MSRSADGLQRASVSRSDLRSRSTKAEPVEPFSLKVTSLPGRNDDERMRVMQRMLRVWARIGSDPVRGCGLRDLAGVSNYSSTHLQRTFKRIFGLSPYKLAIVQRMQIARELLKDTGMPIASVASYAGYVDRAAFARAFRRHFGVTPSGMRGRKKKAAIP